MQSSLQFCIIAAKERKMRCIFRIVWRRSSTLRIQIWPPVSQMPQGFFPAIKRQLVAKPDACSDWIPFLVSGVIRGYLTDEKGRDITDCFLYRPGEAVLSLSILTASFPINFEAVTDCVLLSIPTQLLAEQFQQSAELQQLYSSYLLEKLKLERELKLLLGISSAMERYQWFLRRYPELADVVSIKHIASFLCMSPVSLSRLRGQLRKRGEEPPVKQSRLSEKSGLF